jgi:hypothetical protein
VVLEVTEGKMTTDGFGNRLPDSTDAVLRPSFNSLNRDIEARAIEQMHSSLDASVERAAREHEQPQLEFPDAEPSLEIPEWLRRQHNEQVATLEMELRGLQSKPESAE